MKKPSKNVTKTVLLGWNGKFLFGDDHTYWWKDKKGLHPLSGITSVLNVIAKPALIAWSARIAVEHIEQNTSDVELGIARETFDQLLYEAKTKYQDKTTHAANLGTDAHGLVEEYIKSCIRTNKGIPYVTEGIDAGGNPRVREFSVWAVSRNTETGFKFTASETPLADPKLAIAGTPDFIAEETVDGLWKPIIGDLKTGSGIYDRVYFFQMAAYGYMWMKREKRKEEPKLVIIHMPAQKPNQPMAEYWSEDFKGDWEAFKAALVLHRSVHNFKKPKT